MRRILILIALLVSSCGVQKSVSTRDTLMSNVKTVTEVKYLTVDVPLPEVFQSVETRDTSSHLENDYASSDAVVSNGTLKHSLHINPKGKSHIQKEVPERNTFRDSIVYKTKDVEVPVYIEKDLTKWQQFKINVGGYTLGALAAILLILLVKLLLKLKKSAFV